MELYSRDKILVKILVVCLAVGIAHSVLHDLPSYFPRCKRYDPKLNECLVNATEQARPFLIKGVPEVGFISIEPFIVPEITLQRDSVVLNGKALLKNLRVTGLSSYKFSQIKFDIPNLEFFGNVTFGNLFLEGDYSLTGMVLFAPIRGKGRFAAAISNANVTVYQKLDIVKKTGIDYLFPIVTNTTMKTGRPKLHLDGLFDGDEESNRITNAIINDNIDELYEDIKPVIEEVVTNIAEYWLFKSLEDNVPFDKLFPKE